MVFMAQKDFDHLIIQTIIPPLFLFRNYGIIKNRTGGHMSNHWFIFIGLCFNIAGAFLMAFHFMWKTSKPTKNGLRRTTFGPRKNVLEIGAILLAIGFVLQVFGLPLKTMF